MRNTLKIDFTIGNEKIALFNLLGQINSKEEYSYYILYGYREYVINLDQYLIYNEELKSEHGFFKIRDTTNSQIPLIIDLFKEFQICSLVLSRENLDYKKYDFSNLRLMNINARLNIFQGYEISEIGENYLILNSYKTFLQV